MQNLSKGMAVLALLTASIAQAATINVNPGNDTISAAITAAAPGDTLLLAPGTYTKTSPTAALNVTKSVHIIGPMDNVDPNGALQADGSRPLSASRGTGEAVIQFGFSVAPAAGLALDGFTIAGVTFQNVTPTILNHQTTTVAAAAAKAASGTGDIVVTRTAHPYNTGDRVTLSGFSNALLNNTFTVTKTGANTYTLDGTAAGTSFTSISGQSRIENQAISNLTFRYNIVDTFANQGVNRGAGAALSHTITYNRFVNYTGIDKTAIWYSGTAVNRDFVITYNYFSDPDRTPGSRGIIVGGAWNARVENNTFFRLGRYACQFADGANLGPNGEAPTSIFRYNSVTEVNAGVQVLSTNSPSGQPEGADISNNTFRNMLPTLPDVDGNPAGINNVRAILFSAQVTGSLGAGVFDDVSIYNNTIIQDVGLMQNTNGLIDIQLDPASSLTHGDVEVYNNNVTLTGTLPNVGVDSSTFTVSAVKAVTGSGRITVTHTGHPYATGNVVSLFVAPAGTVLFAAYTINVIDANTYEMVGSEPMNAFAGTSFVAQAIPSSAYGIRIRGEVTDAEIAGNTITSTITNTSSNPVPVAGIFVDNNDPTFGAIPGTGVIDLTDNTITGTDTGIRLEGAPNTNVTGNTIGGTDTGIEVTSEATTAPRIENNNLNGNTAGIANNGAAPLDATGNFWGSPSGAAPGQVTGTGSTDSGSPLADATFPLDSDRDGLSDFEESNLYGTNPAEKDTDGDGLSDGIEVAANRNPLSAADPGANTDTDADGIADVLEIVLGYNPNNPDQDNDGFLDGYEFGLNANLTSSIVLGDVTGTGGTNNTDAIRILEHFLGLALVQPSSLNKGDINRDGLVDNVDAIILYQWSLDRIDTIPFPNL